MFVITFKFIFFQFKFNIWGSKELTAKSQILLWICRKFGFAPNSRLDEQ